MAVLRLDDIGSDDLTQYALAVDRNNGNVADRFAEPRPAVLKLRRSHRVPPGVRRRHEPLRPGRLETGDGPVLVHEGMASTSTNIDPVRDVQHEVERVEQKLILDSGR